MNELTMLPIEWLEHHPDNPRKDLGDLKELTASIRESGVMQNLTVVPRGAAERPAGCGRYRQVERRVVARPDADPDGLRGGLHHDGQAG